MIRLRLTDGATALFDNVVDLFDFVVERDWLNLVRPAVDDEGAVQSFERAVSDRKRDLREPQEG